MAETAVILLAAGKGTRMKSGRAKVLHELCGRPMLGHTLALAESFDPARLLVVVGRDSDQVEQAFAVVVERRNARADALGQRVHHAAGDDVLEVDVSIVDLYLNAPDIPSSSRVDYYTISTGEMTLQAELRDSASGDLIARVLDRKVDPDEFQPRFTTSVDNDAAARDAARIWARALRSQLDAARRIGS